MSCSKGCGCPTPRGWGYRSVHIDARQNEVGASNGNNMCDIRYEHPSNT